MPYVPISPVFRPQLTDSAEQRWQAIGQARPDLSPALALQRQLLTEENKAGSGLRVFVQGGGCSGFQYGLMIEENGQGAGDQVFESHGVKLFIDPISIRYLNGAEVDFVDTITGGGFTIKNPNATSTCGCGQSFSVE